MYDKMNEDISSIEANLSVALMENEAARALIFSAAVAAKKKAFDAYEASFSAQSAIDVDVELQKKSAKDEKNKNGKNVLL